MPEVFLSSKQSKANLISFLLLLMSSILVHCSVSTRSQSPPTQPNPPAELKKGQEDLLQSQKDKARLMKENQELKEEIAKLKQGKNRDGKQQDSAQSESWKEPLTQFLKAQRELEQQLDALLAEPGQTKTKSPSAQVSSECQMLAEGLMQTWLGLDFLERVVRDVAMREPVGFPPMQSISVLLHEPIRHMIITIYPLLRTMHALRTASSSSVHSAPAVQSQPSRSKVRAVLKRQEEALHRFLEVAPPIN